MRARVINEAVINGGFEPPTVETPFGTIRCALQDAPATGDWGSAEWTVDQRVHPEPAKGAPAVWEDDEQVSFQGIVGEVFDDGLFVLRLGTGATVMVESEHPPAPRSTVRFSVPRSAVSLTFYRT